LTAGTRRSGSSKFGPFRWPAEPRYDEFEGQAQEGRFAELVSYDEYGHTAFDGTAFDGTAFDDTAFERAAFDGDGDSYANASTDVYAEPPAPAALAGGAPGNAEPGRNAGRYTGRHVMSPRTKTTRMRVGKVVPVAAVAATIAAGTAAYGLASGGPSQPAHTSATMSLPGTLESTSAASLANASTAPSGLVKVAKATGAGAAESTGKHAKPAPRRTPAATPSAAATHAAAKASTPAAPKHAAPAVTHASSPATTAKAAPATTLSCNVSYGMLPDNVTAIVSFLLANGYSDNAAAGIAGNMYQESKGNPESEGMGGGGLIGWTPLPAGFVTGNVTADLQTQLSALLTYNQGWSGYLPALNSAASPSDAAYIYVTDFERAGIPAASTRETAAQNVASACGI
jgi:hypothetical protein